MKSDKYKDKTEHGRKIKKEENQDDFLYELWKKLHKFKSKTTGSKKLDAKIIKAFGPWRKGQ